MRNGFHPKNAFTSRSWIYFEVVHFPRGLVSCLSNSCLVLEIFMVYRKWGAHVKLTPAEQASGKRSFLFLFAAVWVLWCLIYRTFVAAFPEFSRGHFISLPQRREGRMCVNDSLNQSRLRPKKCIKDTTVPLRFLMGIPSLT